MNTKKAKNATKTNLSKVPALGSTGTNTSKVGRPPKVGPKRVTITTTLTKATQEKITRLAFYLTTLEGTTVSRGEVMDRLVLGYSSALAKAAKAKKAGTK